MGQSNTIQTVDFDGFDVLKTIFGSTSGQHPAHIWKDMLHEALMSDLDLFIATEFSTLAILNNPFSGCIRQFITALSNTMIKFVETDSMTRPCSPLNILALLLVARGLLRSLSSRGSAFDFLFAIEFSPVSLSDHDPEDIPEGHTRVIHQSGRSLLVPSQSSPEQFDALISEWLSEFSLRDAQLMQKVGVALRTIKGEVISVNDLSKIPQSHVALVLLAPPEKDSTIIDFLASSMRLSMLLPKSEVPTAVTEVIQEIILTTHIILLSIILAREEHSITTTANQLINKAASQPLLSKDLRPSTAPPQQPADANNISPNDQRENDNVNQGIPLSITTPNAQSNGSNILNYSGAFVHFGRGREAHSAPQFFFMQQKNMENVLNITGGTNAEGYAPQLPPAPIFDALLAHISRPGCELEFASIKYFPDVYLSHLLELVSSDVKVSSPRTPIRVHANPLPSRSVIAAVELLAILTSHPSHLFSLDDLTDPSNSSSGGGASSSNLLCANFSRLLHGLCDPRHLLLTPFAQLLSRLLDRSRAFRQAALAKSDADLFFVLPCLEALYRLTFQTSHAPTSMTNTNGNNSKQVPSSEGSDTPRPVSSSSANQHQPLLSTSKPSPHPSIPYLLHVLLIASGDKILSRTMHLNVVSYTTIGSKISSETKWTEHPTATLSEPCSIGGLAFVTLLKCAGHLISHAHHELAITLLLGCLHNVALSANCVHPLAAVRLVDSLNALCKALDSQLDALLAIQESIKHDRMQSEEVVDEGEEVELDALDLLEDSPVTQTAANVRKLLTGVVGCVLQCMSKLSTRGVHMDALFYEFLRTPLSPARKLLLKLRSSLEQPSEDADMDVRISFEQRLESSRWAFALEEILLHASCVQESLRRTKQPGNFTLVQGRKLIDVTKLETLHCDSSAECLSAKYDLIEKWGSQGETEDFWNIEELICAMGVVVTAYNQQRRQILDMRRPSGAVGESTNRMASNAFWLGRVFNSDSELEESYMKAVQFEMRYEEADFIVNYGLAWASIKEDQRALFELLHLPIPAPMKVLSK